MGENKERRLISLVKLEVLLALLPMKQQLRSSVKNGTYQSQRKRVQVYTELSRSVMNDMPCR